MPTFEFIRLGIPCTVQTKSKSRLDNYRRDVRRAASARWPGDKSSITLPVSVVISYYYTIDEIDIDNILKPILDEMNGLVYVDDRQVIRVVGQKSSVFAGSPSLLSPPRLTSVLEGGLRSKQDFVYVLVEWE